VEVGYPRFVLQFLRRKEEVQEVAQEVLVKELGSWRVPDLVSITTGATGMGGIMATTDNSRPHDTNKMISGTDIGNLTEATAPLVKKVAGVAATTLTEILTTGKTPGPDQTTTIVLPVTNVIRLDSLILADR